MLNTILFSQMRLIFKVVPWVTDPVKRGIITNQSCLQPRTRVVLTNALRAKWKLYIYITFVIYCFPVVLYCFLSWTHSFPANVTSSWQRWKEMGLAYNCLLTLLVKHFPYNRVVFCNFCKLVSQILNFETLFIGLTLNWGTKLKFSLLNINNAN